MICLTINRLCNETRHDRPARAEKSDNPSMIIDFAGSCAGYGALLQRTRATRHIQRCLGAVLRNKATPQAFQCIAAHQNVAIVDVEGCRGRAWEKDVAGTSRLRHR